MSVSLLLAKLRGIVQRQQEDAGVQRPGLTGQGFHAMAFLNGRCIADVSISCGQDEIFESERRFAVRE
jgi:hypothetical protein